MKGDWVRLQTNQVFLQMVKPPNEADGTRSFSPPSIWPIAVADKNDPVSSDFPGSGSEGPTANSNTIFLNGSRTCVPV